jgi:chaperonin GroES
MKFKPLSNKVLVEITERQLTTKSGIVLPEAAEKKLVEGTVIAVGPGKLTEKGTIPVSVKTGDVILFEKPWSKEHEFKEEGKIYFLVSEEEILGVLN